VDLDVVKVILLVDVDVVKVLALALAMHSLL
jgi:hypothetical protein